VLYNASKRETGDAGKAVRRIIVLSILFGVILAPFILAMFGMSSIVEIDVIQPTYLFGIFGGGIEKAFIRTSELFINA